jgi:hypothetical protein
MKRLHVNEELERIWKEAVVAKFMMLSRNSPGETAKKQEKKLKSG